MEHKSPDRGLIVVFVVLRALLGVGILVFMRAFWDDKATQERSDKWHRTSDASASRADLQRVQMQAGVSPVGKSSAASPSRKSSSGKTEPQFRSQEQMREYHQVTRGARAEYDGKRGTNEKCDCGFMLACLAWTIFDIAQIFVSNEKASGTHNVLAHAAQVGLWIAHFEWFRGVLMGGSGDDSKAIGAAIGGLFLIVQLGIGLYLLATLGDEDNNESWSNTQWVGNGVQIGLFVSAGLSM